MRYPRLTRSVPALALFLVTATLSTGTASASGSARLRREVLPTFERIELNLDARKKSYSGSVSIDLRVASTTDSFQFHSEGLTLRRVTLRSGKAIVASTHAPAGTTMETVHTKSPLKPGRYTLDVDFTNTFSERAQGLYRLETGGQSYCFSQFEADDARKSFPCWDEPSFKIPYQLTIVVPSAHRAVTNTPVARTIPGKGVKTVVFRKTKPMPSYILAISTGPLELVPITGMSVPGNVVTVKGASKLAGTAAKMAPPILAALERYFGRPYPYEKLDVIAVPEFWPGAMENAGAVTFRDEVLLVDPKTAGIAQLSTLSVFMAHEFAHMWFGNLVTMEWWDDLWLNEAFAEWMGNKISDEVNPQYKRSLIDLRETQGAMGTDSRLSTRAIRKPVDALTNLLQAADELAYKKGQAVLTMFEEWLGPETFRTGVNAYLKEHEWGNAVGADLWDSLSKVSGKDATLAMSSFLDQGGVPLVTAEIRDDGKVTLRQKRFLAYGVTAPREQLWRIPVALRYSDGGPTRTQHVLLAEREMTVELDGVRKPAWVNPNAAGAGYYRWSVPSATLAKIAENAPSTMTTKERVGFLGNATALLEAGIVHGDECFKLVSPFAADPDPEVVTALLDNLAKLRGVFVTREIEGAYAAYLRRTLGPTLDRIGMAPKDGESQGTSVARAGLLLALGDDGKDTRVLDYAESLARKHIAEPGSVDRSLITVSLNLSAIRGDEALFNDYKQRFETVEIPAERARYLDALGYFRDPKLADMAIRYSLTGPLRPQEVFAIPPTVAHAVEFEDYAFKWVTENYDTIASKIPPMYMVFMPAFVGTCYRDKVENAKAFFADPKHQVAGTDSELAKVVDRSTDCAGLRAREGQSVVAYLREMPGAQGGSGTTASPRGGGSN